MNHTTTLDGVAITIKGTYDPDNFTYTGVAFGHTLSLTKSDLKHLVNRTKLWLAEQDLEVSKVRVQCSITDSYLEF